MMYKHVVTFQRNFSTLSEKLCYYPDFLGDRLLFCNLLDRDFDLFFRQNVPHNFGTCTRKSFDLPLLRA